MASIGHVAVGMAAARLFRSTGTPRFHALTAYAAWSALSLLPDADVLGMSLGIAYADTWGHRGATHSFVFALAVGLSAALFAGSLRLPRMRTAWFAGLLVASHPLLDTLTDGGLGCALFWPFDDARIFAPVTPIPVAPIGRALLSRAGLRVALIECVSFGPFLAYALWPSFVARRRKRT